LLDDIIYIYYFHSINEKDFKMKPKRSPGRPIEIEERISIYFNLPRKLNDKLYNEARKMKWSKSELIRSILAEHYEHDGL